MINILFKYTLIEPQIHFPGHLLLLESLAERVPQQEEHLSRAFLGYWSPCQSHLGICLLLTFLTPCFYFGLDQGW